MADALPCPWCGKPAKVIDGEWAVCSSTDDPRAETCAGELFEVGVPLRLWNRRAGTPDSARQRAEMKPGRQEDGSFLMVHEVGCTCMDCRTMRAITRKPDAGRGGREA